MNKNILIIVGVIVAGGLVLFVFLSNKEKNLEMVKNEIVQQQRESQNSSQNEIQKIVNDDSDMKTPEQKSPVVSNVGSYEIYSPEEITRADSGKVVLFFHASWCPSCRALNGDIEKNIDSLPAGVTILKTDYDKETELKKKYGVTYQHTLVQVDTDGNMIKKWSGDSKLEKLLLQIQ